MDDYILIDFEFFPKDDVYLCAVTDKLKNSRIYIYKFNVKTNQSVK